MGQSSSWNLIKHVVCFEVRAILEPEVWHSVSKNRLNCENSSYDRRTEHIRNDMETAKRMSGVLFLGFAWVADKLCYTRYLGSHGGGAQNLYRLNNACSGRL